MELKAITAEEFDAFYPIKMKAVSGTPWIRVDMAKKAIVFLCDCDDKYVWDLGSC